MAFVASKAVEDVEDDNSPVKIKMMTSKPEVYKGEVITVQCLVTNHEPDWDEITVEINRSVFNRYSVSTLVMLFLFFVPTPSNLLKCTLGQNHKKCLLYPLKYCDTRNFKANFF